MTNFEKYYNIVKKHVENKELFAVVNNIPTNCHDTPCELCDFNHNKDQCEFNCIKWLFMENRILTKEEHAFCEMINIGYLTRDEYGNLWYSVEEPCKQNSQWIGSKFFMNPKLFPKFTFISWKDEPYKIEDLLTYPIEVKEGATA